MLNNDIVNNSPFIVFGPSTTTANATNGNTFQRNISKCLFGVLAAGGTGGTSGWSDVAGAATTPSGGGGGAGGGVFFMPGYLLPSIINVSVGAGGAGGVASRGASAPGSLGTKTDIFVNNSNSPLFTANPGGAGAAATTSAAGTGGAIGTIGGYLSCGIFILIPNSGGAAGGTTGAASAIGATVGFISGGSGGGAITTTNIAFKGADINAVGLQTVTTGLTGPNIAPTAQSFLFDSNMPNSSKGGCGGGSSSAAAGSDGAPGGFGSGGGGGGSSNSAASNGGSGGKGGAGFAILVEI